MWPHHQNEPCGLPPLPPPPSGFWHRDWVQVALYHSWWWRNTCLCPCLHLWRDPDGFSCTWLGALTYMACWALYCFVFLMAESEDLAHYSSLWLSWSRCQKERLRVTESDLTNDVQAHSPHPSRHQSTTFRDLSQGYFSFIEWCSWPLQLLLVTRYPHPSTLSSRVSFPPLPHASPTPDARLVTLQLLLVVTLAVAFWELARAASSLSGLHCILLHDSWFHPAKHF